MSYKKISVVFPCYNEEANISRGVLEQVFTFFNGQDYEYEVIIADDSSTDNSFILCEEFSSSHKNFRVIRLEHGGKPHALYRGLNEVKGEIVLFADMDQSTPISEITKLLFCLDNGYDIVIGSRGRNRSGFSTIRQLTSWGFRNLRKLFLLSSINDTQCGFKAARTSIAKEIFPLLSFFSANRKIKGWVVSAYDVEFLFIAKKNGYKIKEIGVEWEHRDTSNTKERSGRKYLTESLEMIMEIIQIGKNNLTGKYNFSKKLNPPSHMQ